MHGTPFSSYVWRSVARALAQDHQVLVRDMPGYGASEKSAGQDVSLRAQAQVFTELFAHWKLDQPSVVAHDFGGCVALRAHLLHGAGYRHLALVDPVALAPWGPPAYQLLGGRAHVFGKPPAALHRALVREYVSSASHPGLHPAVLDRLVDPSPVFICWGAQDNWIPVARGHELARLVSGAALRLMEGAGRLVQEDSPAELSAALDRFLRSGR